MKIRASVDLNGTSLWLSFFSVLEETPEHLALKLAAALFFFDEKPMIVSHAEQHPALSGQEFSPDLVSVNAAGSVQHWVECGKTTSHKLDKVSKRYRNARITVLTPHPREGRQVAEMLSKDAIRGIQVWSFKEKEFPRWQQLVAENNSIIGEATPTGMNLVINDQLFITELEEMAVTAG